MAGVWDQTADHPLTGCRPSTIPKPQSPLKRILLQVLNSESQLSSTPIYKSKREYKESLLQGRISDSSMLCGLSPVKMSTLSLTSSAAQNEEEEADFSFMRPQQFVLYFHLYRNLNKQIRFIDF